MVAYLCERKRAKERSNHEEENDKRDNDQDGEVDELRENWSMSSSGINLTLGYKF